MKGEFLYRDAGNWKKEVFVDLPEDAEFEPGDEVLMEEVGVKPEDVWDSFAGGSDASLDHEMLEFVGYVEEES